MESPRGAANIPSSGYGALKTVTGSSCSGGPGSVPVLVTFTYSGTTLTLTDTGGVRYIVNVNGVPQYGSTLYGTPAALSVSNGPTFTQGSVELEAGNGVVFNGLITGVAANG